MVATIAIASMAMEAVPRTALPDVRFPTHYAVGLSMPYPVVMDQEHGWAFLAIFFVFVALMAVLAVLAARALRGCGQYASGLLVLGLVVVLAMMTAFPVTFSVDSYAYAAFGRLLGVHGLNPYVERLAAGNALGDDVLARLASFLGTPLPDENYGPLWTWLSAGLAIAAKPGGLALAVWMQRAAAAAALVVAAVGLLRANPDAPPQMRASRAALFALHPLALYESAAAGHNDMLMIAPAVWAFVLAGESPIAAGLLVGASIAVKYVGLVALPFLVLRVFARRGLRAAVLATVLAIAVPVVLFAGLWPGWQALGTLANLGSTLIMSPQWLAAMWLPFVGWRVLSLCFLAAFGLVLAYSIVRYARDGCVWHTFRSITALLWSSPLLNPWYVQWLLPAAATAGRWASYAWWFGLFALARYVEDALRFPATQSELSARIVLLEVVTIVMLAAPIVLALTVRNFPLQGQPDGDA
jgi:hypothetical protein